MGNTLPSDAELLAAWLDHGHEAAFRDLVSRYAGLVQQTALRVCRDESLAADISQQVFILLTRKARSLRRRSSLAGWLHHAAVMQARNAVRSHLRESRKRQSLHAAMDSHPPSSSAWDAIRPALDEALSSLSERDREILLLHYYRSLGVDQISALLGIAGAAVRKRLTRSTDRLRDRLARRGIHTSQAFCCTLAAGFSLDASSAVPAAKLATTALSSATAATPQTATTLILLTAMKSTWLPPIAALLIALLWLTPKHHALSVIERNTPISENSRFSSSANPILSNSRSRPVNSVAESASNAIDWLLEASRVETARRSGHGGIDDQLGLRLSKLAPEELLRQLDVLAQTEMRPQLRLNFDYEVARHLAVFRDPEFALEHLIGRAYDRSDLAGLLPFAISRLAEKQPEAAIAWLDQQIASGTLKGKRLDQSSYRDEHEVALFNTLLGVQPGLAIARLETLTEEQRAAAIAPYYRLDPDPATQIAFANLARQYLPEEERMQVLASQAARNIDEGFDEITRYLDRIDATDVEREFCIESAAISMLPYLSNHHQVTSQQIDRMRDWLGQYYPEKVERATGESLAKASLRPFQSLSLADAAAFAARYDASGGGEVLSTFLSQPEIASRTAELNTIARSTSDETLRSEILRYLETP